MSFDHDLGAQLRPPWLRPATLALAIFAHAGVLAVVLWPRSVSAPAETSIEVTITPAELSSEPAAGSPAAAAAAPAEARPVDGKPLEAKAVEASPVDMSSPSVPTAAVAPAEAAPVVPKPVEIAPAPPSPPTQIPIAQSPPPAAKPAPAPPSAKAVLEEAERAAAEKSRQLLLRQKQEAEREAAQRAATEKAKRAADNARRQAEQREAQRAAAAKRAALPPASSPAADVGEPRRPVGGASPAAIGAYRGEVMGHLAGFKRYPEAARARGAEGRPSIAFTLDASGRVASVSLTRASGQSDIDAEAVAMVRRASPFPAPPPGASRSFTATIGFVLH